MREGEGDEKVGVSAFPNTDNRPLMISYLMDAAEYTFSMSASWLNPEARYWALFSRPEMNSRKSVGESPGCFKKERTAPESDFPCTSSVDGGCSFFANC